MEDTATFVGIEFKVISNGSCISVFQASTTTYSNQDNTNLGFFLHSAYQVLI